MVNSQAGSPSLIKGKLKILKDLEVIADLKTKSETTFPIYDKVDDLKKLSRSMIYGIMVWITVCSLIFTVWFTVFRLTLRFSFKNRKADRKAETLWKFTVFIYGFTVLRLRFTVTVTVTVRLRSTIPTVTRGLVYTEILSWTNNRYVLKKYRIWGGGISIKRQLYLNS